MSWTTALSAICGLLLLLVVGMGVSVMRIQRSVHRIQALVARRGRDSEGPELGALAPVLVHDTTDTGGDPSPLSLEADATVVWFFSVECAPCADLRPIVSSIAATYHGRARLVVSCIGSSTAVADFTQEMAGACTILADPHRQNAVAWNVPMVPFVIVLDRGSMVRQKVIQVSAGRVRVALDSVLAADR